MTRYLKTFGIIIILSSCSVFGFIKLYKWYYYKEYNEIINSLNKLPNVKVIDSGGHDDVTFEHVGAKLLIKGKGILTLMQLNKAENDYPNNVLIEEIGGYNFRIYSCDGGLSTNYYLNIGNSSIFHKLLGKEFNYPIDVINSYDNILSTIDTMPKFPDVNHYYVGNDSLDSFLIISKKDSKCLDSLTCSGYTNLYKYLKSLDWKHRDCIDKF